MSFAGLLGAGLLGGMGNAAKGIGDRLREEAKQKRASALQTQIKQDTADQAVIDQENALIVADRKSGNRINELRAQGLVTQEINNNQFGNNTKATSQAAEIATALATLQSSLKIKEDSLSTVQKAALTKARDQLKLQHEKGLAGNAAELLSAQTKLDSIIDAAKVAQAVKTDALVAAQTVKTDAKVAEKLTDDKIEINAAKPVANSNKPMTDVQLQSHVNAQSWKHAGGKVDKNGEQLPLSPEDSKLVAGWNKKAFAKIQAMKDAGVSITPAVVSSVIEETFVRPFDVTKIKLTQEDRAKANDRYDDEASSMESDSSQFGMSESQIKRQWATENAVRRQPDFASAQKTWDENVVGPKVTQAMVDEGRRRIKALLADKGYDPSLIVE